MHYLIGFHAALGEIGAICFLWVFIEMLQKTPKADARARMASWIGLGFLLLAWVVGGWYYLVHYGPEVKPLIKAGPQPWAHLVFMEAKEHIFLFIPFIAFAVCHLFKASEESQPLNRKSILWLSGTVYLVGMGMAAMGYMITTGARLALKGVLS